MRSTIAQSLKLGLGIGLVLLISSFLRVPCEELPKSPTSPKTTGNDPYLDGMSALRSGNFEEAIRLLGSVREDHPRFNEAMVMVGLNLCGRQLDKPERGLPYVERAYAKAPEDMEVAKAYIDILVQSGKAFPAAKPERVCSKEVKPEFRFLAKSFKGLDDSPHLSRAKVEEDLDYFELRLKHCYSYLERRGVDYEGRSMRFECRLRMRTGCPSSC